MFTITQFPVEHIVCVDRKICQLEEYVIRMIYHPYVLKNKLFN
jgi:hypothetical protein